MAFNKIIFLILSFSILLGAVFYVFNIDDFERAEKMFERGEHVSAFQIYIELAEEGDARAQFAVSRIYEQGVGQNIYDETKALRWLSRSAANGYSPAQFRLGTLYYEGKVLSQDLVLAELWWGRASDGNYPGAWEKLLSLYPLNLNASSTESKLWHQNDNIFRLWELTNKGEMFANVLMGVFSTLGRGVEINIEEALSYLNVAVENSNPNGQYALGRLYYLGEFVEKNESKALDLFLLSASQGQLLSQLFLGDIFEKRSDSIEDKKEALFWTLVALRVERVNFTNVEKLVAKRSRGLGKAEIDSLRQKAKSWKALNRPYISKTSKDILRF